MSRFCDRRLYGLICFFLLVTMFPRDVTLSTFSRACPSTRMGAFWVAITHGRGLLDVDLDASKFSSGEKASSL